MPAFLLSGIFSYLNYTLFDSFTPVRLDVPVDPRKFHSYSDYIGHLENSMQQVQLREAKARLSAIVENAALGESAVITRRGQPRAVIIGIDEWNRLRRVPSFGRLLAASGLEDEDIPPRDRSPLGDAAL